MTDDLTTRALRELADHKALDIDAIALREAADHIEALEAELLHEQGQTQQLRVMNVALERASSARDAVIAEALAVLSASDPTEREEAAWAILSRVPQGAAEPNPYEAMVAEKRDAEDDERDWERPDVTSHINRLQYDAEEGTADRIRAGSGMEPEYGEGNCG